MTIGAYRGAHEIKLRESNGVSIYNQVFARLKVVSGISSVHNQAQFKSQEPKTCEVIRSGTDRLPPALVHVDLINEAQLRHGPSELEKTDLDPAEDKADHTLAVPVATTDPIDQSSLESDSEGDGEVYMVGNGEEPQEKTIEEIQREAKEEIAHTTRLDREAEKGKRHNDLQDDSGESDDEPRDGTPMRRHHPKFNPRHPANRDRLWNRSRSIREEMGWIEYQGEQVYHILAQNALASRMLIHQLALHLPKDNEEVNAHMKCLQAMLDAAIVVDPTLDHDDKAWGHELDHR
jgi:hypothetical protein